MAETYRGGQRVGTTGHTTIEGFDMRDTQKVVTHSRRGV